MFDMQATVRWVTGMLKAPVDTAKTYREADPPWMQTLMQLPLPLVVAGAVLAFLVAWLTGGTFGLGVLGIGSVIYMTKDQLRWALHGRRLIDPPTRSLAWFFVRPLFGVFVAFATYLLGHRIDQFPGLDALGLVFANTGHQTHLLALYRGQHNGR